MCKVSSPYYLGDINRYIIRRQLFWKSGALGTATMRQRPAPYADEALPDYSAQDEQPKPPKWRWWWRKRVWMPSAFLIALLLFGIIFGAAYGSEKSKFGQGRTFSPEVKTLT